MKLNDYDVRKDADKIEYKRNENGLYTVDIKNYILMDSDGNEHSAHIKIPNTKLPVDDEEGIIDLNLENMKYLSPMSEPEEDDGTLWEIIVSD